MQSVTGAKGLLKRPTDFRKKQELQIKGSGKSVRFTVETKQPKVIEHIKVPKKAKKESKSSTIHPWTLKLSRTEMQE